MSFQAAVSNLRSPVSQLVLNATNDRRDLISESESDQAKIVEWIEKAGQVDLSSDSNLENLDDNLVSKTYIATNYLTAADVALYGVLHPAISTFQPPQYYNLPSVTRYFDHIQSNPVVRASADSLQQFPIVSFDLENAPNIKRKAGPSKKKEGKAPATVPEAAAAPNSTEKTLADAPSTALASSEKSQKKGKKDKNQDVQEEGSKKKAKAPAVPLADEGEPVPSMIDLRVGHIVDVIKHPDADGLYVEQIDVGEETGPRTVVSGLVNYIPIENMQDKYLVAVCNLKPANMRGVKSFAMVLCATSKDGKDGGIELIQPPPDSKPGDRVYFEGEAYENATPLLQLNPKKKIFETIQPGFLTLDTKEAAWINPSTKIVHKIRTTNGVCVAPTLVGASLS